MFPDYIEPISDIVTYTAHSTHIVQNIVTLQVDTRLLYICDPTQIQKDKGCQELLQGQSLCKMFMNQDLTFLQPTTIHKQNTEEENTRQLLNTAEPTDSPQEQHSDPQPILPVEIILDRSRANDSNTPIQAVEPVIGLTPEEQQLHEEVPDLMLEELLGLHSCQGHVNTPLQTLDSIYVMHQQDRLLLSQLHLTSLQFGQNKEPKRLESASSVRAR